MPVRSVVSVGKILQLNLLLVAGLFLSATQAKAQGVNGDDPTGVYTLVTVNVSKLPANVSHGDVAIQVRSGTFTFNADGTCSSKVVFGPPSGTDVTREVNATYTRKGSRLNMQWKGAGKTVGTVEGDSFTMNNEGVVFAYKKQPATPASDKHKVLDRFIGTWRTDYKIPRTEWTPVEKTGAADLTYRRVLGEKFVQEQGEHADKTTGLSMYTYDTQSECYRSWWFLSTGQTSEATGQWDADTKTLTWTSVAGAGQEFTTTARHRFVNDNTFQWDVISKDGKGKVLFRMEGNATRTALPGEAQEAVTIQQSPELKVLQRFIGSWEQQVVSKPAEWTPKKTTMTLPALVRRVLAPTTEEPFADRIDRQKNEQTSKQASEWA